LAPPVSSLAASVPAGYLYDPGGAVGEG